MLQPDPVARLRAGDHVASFYQDRRQQWATVLPFIRRGLDNHEKCLYVTDAGRVEEIETLLQGHAIPVPALRRRGQLVILTPAETYLRSGTFTSDLVLDLWDKLTRAAIAEGYRSLCLVAEMSWALQVTTALSHLAEYEAQVNVHLAHLPLVALCQYDRRHFPEDLLLDILRTHPIVFLDGEHYNNAYYLPPHLYLTGDRREEFRWYLHQLRHSHVERSPIECQTAGPGRWQIHCLGELRVVRDGVPVNWDEARGATRKVKTLFS